MSEIALDKMAKVVQQDVLEVDKKGQQAVCDKPSTQAPGPPEWCRNRRSVNELPSIRTRGYSRGDFWSRE